MTQVTYRDPSGQVVTTDLNNAPPQVQTLYNQNYLQPQASLQQTQTSTAATGAEIPAIQANAEKAKIAAQQAGATQSLSKDLQNKMTLDSALKKYRALGMSADDIFNQYLSESPWGLPNEDPQKLQGMGIKAETLGSIGTPGSFMDKYNTRNAISGLRNLEDLWNKTNTFSRIGGMLGVNVDASNYNTAKEIFGNHLSTLIPGAPGGQQTAKDLLNTLPDANDLRENVPGKATGQFSTIEDQLLKTKGYSPKDLGIPDRSGQTQKTPTTGKDLLSTLLTNAGKDITGITQSLASNPFTGIGIAALNPEKTQAYVEQNNPISLLAGMGKQYADIATNPIESLKEHPVNTPLAVLGPLLGLKGGGAVEGEAAAAEGATGATEAASNAADAFAKAPGKLEQFLTPGKAKNAIGQIRDNIISTADKSGAVIKGDDLATGIRQWADQAKLSNLPDADAIEQAATNAEKQYTGKTFKPSDLKGIYDNIEKGYTKGGEPRSATASYIDRGVQGVLSDQLEQAAPGFAKTSDLFRQTFQAEKSPIKGIAKRAAGVGLGLGGLDVVRHILGL